MINFSDGFTNESADADHFSMEDLKSLINKALKSGGKTIFDKGSYHGGLSPVQLENIISYLIYTKGYSSLNVTICLEGDGYHLGLFIKDKQK